MTIPESANLSLREKMLISIVFGAESNVITAESAKQLADRIIQSITTDDVKRWFQILVGIGEEEMKKEMSRGDWGTMAQNLAKEIK